MSLRFSKVWKPTWATSKIYKPLVLRFKVKSKTPLFPPRIVGHVDASVFPVKNPATIKSPILVPSRRAARQVGYVDPTTHAVFWFTIHNDDNTYYIKDLGLFFKMLHIPDESAAADAH